MTSTRPTRLTDELTERGVLGCAIMHDSALKSLCARCTDSDFSGINNRSIYKAMYKLYITGTVVDVISVEKTVSDNGMISLPPTYTMKLIDDACMPSAIEHHLTVLLEMSVARRVYETLNHGLSALHAGSKPSEVLKSIDQVVANGYNRLAVQDTRSITQVCYEHLEQIQSGEDEYRFTVDIPVIDKYTPTKEELWVIAARPSVGKTSLSLWLAETYVNLGRSVLYCSLEQSIEQIMHKRWAMSTGIDSNKFGRKGELTTDDWTTLTGHIDKLNKTDMVVRDDLYTVGSILAEMRARHYDLVVVDYLQYMWLPGKRMEVYELGDISKALKTAARQMKTPVMLLSQLSRPDSEARKPILKDLRGSGEIEQDVDDCWMLWKPDNSSSKMEVLCRKQRNGPIGGFELVHDLKTGRFKPDW